MLRLSSCHCKHVLSLFAGMLAVCLSWLLFAAGPSYSSSTVSDILSVPASLDTSLSAPPGDPTLRPPPKHPRANQSRFLDVLPRPQREPSLKPPLIPLGLGSPTTPKHPTRMGGRAPQSGMSSFQPGQQHVPLDGGEGRGVEEGLPASPQPVRSHLTMGIMQQDEERRASNAQAETSSSPPTGTATTNRQKELSLHSSLKGNSSRAAHQQKAAAGSLTPFELASQEFPEEQGPASPHDSENHSGNLSITGAQGEAHCDDKAATRPLNGKPAHPVPVPQSCAIRSSASLADLRQHDGQAGGFIEGSSSEAEERLQQTLQSIKFVSLHHTFLLFSGT